MLQKEKIYFDENGNFSKRILRRSAEFAEKMSLVSNRDGCINKVIR